MLTQLEKQTLSWLYNVVCRFCTIPFTWKNGEMLLKRKGSVTFWNYFTWALVVVTLVFQAVHFPVMVENKNLNMLVLHGASFVGHLVLVISKLNIGTYQAEMVHLINQVFYINAFWGIRLILLWDQLGKK